MTNVSDRIVTVPNALSVLRLALIPVFLWLLAEKEYSLALLVIVVSSLTDFVDGYIARRFNQVSRVGQLLDPAVDRLFIFSTLVGLAVAELVPWWLVLAIAARDVLIAALGVVLARVGHGALPVIFVGKVATFLLLCALPALVVGAAYPQFAGVSAPVGWVCALLGTLLYWWAGAAYVRETVRLVRDSRVAESAPSDTLGK